VTRDDDKTQLDNMVGRAADLFVYAPIGLFFEAPSLLPKLAEQGRVHARNARLFGQFAVRHGEAELRRRVEAAEAQAAELLRTLGLVPEPPAGTTPEPPAPPPSPAMTSRLDAATGNGEEAASPAVVDLAITDYDSLSASQVVMRLEGLTGDELEAVRTYETANRGRKTILNKVAQLQG
jgi:hypothetical protein